VCACVYLNIELVYFLPSSMFFLLFCRRRFHRYNWLWVLFCALIVAGAISDTYFNRNHIDLFTYGGEFTTSKWLIIMSISWGLVVVSFVSIILNHFLRKSCELRVFGGKGSFVLLGWRQAEGLVALIITVAMFYIVFKYTGGTSYFAGLNNV